MFCVRIYGLISKFLTCHGHRIFDKNIMSDILASVFKKTRACSHLIITHLTTQSTPYENNLAQLTLRYSEWLQQQKHTLSRARFIPSDAKSAHTYNDDTQSSRMDNRSEQTSAPEDPVWTALITAADPAYKAAQELLRHSTETSNFFTEDQLREIFTLVCAIRCAQAAQEHNWSIFFQNLDDGEPQYHPFHCHHQFSMQVL